MGSMSAWEPVGDQILVRPLIAADRTASGLLLPEQNRERPQTGIVMAIGPSITRAISVGDLVAFGKYAGMTFQVDGEDVLLMRDLEALARKTVGAYELCEHEIEVGVGTRRVFHELSDRCEHCPSDPPSELIARERARLAGADGTGHP